MEETTIELSADNVVDALKYLFDFNDTDIEYNKSLMYVSYYLKFLQDEIVKNNQGVEGE